MLTKTRTPIEFNVYFYDALISQSDAGTGGVLVAQSQNETCEGLGSIWEDPSSATGDAMVKLV